MASASSSTNYLQRGYVPFSGNPVEFHGWASLFRPNKLAVRAKKMHLVGYNTKSRSYRLWDPAEPLKVTNSAEVSFREKETRDVVSPKVGYDPLPESGRIIYQPGSAETHEEEKEENEGV